ncbi:cytochrome C551 [Chryseobacterium sp. C39-AII1]|uniref:cytochrome C551 n=1 Tax=Chryseobacterium sp. C39-AII1 TaxID=3080332 RepID=UPI00320ACAFE
MKKLLVVFGLGIIAVSCGTKESSMSTSNTDSTTVIQSAPATTDSAVMSTTPDTIKIDSATTVK